MLTATIRLQALHAISLAASSEETRYYLRGVLLEIEPRAVNYVATDGHCLAAYHHGLETDTPDNTLLGNFIVPNTHCRPFKFTPRALASDPRATLSSDTGVGLTFDYDNAGVRFAPIDGAYPDWRRIVPRTIESAGEPAQFNPDYLVGFKKIGELMDAGTVPLVSHNGGSPALITWQSDTVDLFGVLMPIRTDEPALRRPAWVERQEIAAAA